MKSQHHENKTDGSILDGSGLPDYPSSATIPFPFSSGPYPCQAALMDTMLRTLKLIDEKDLKYMTNAESNDIFSASRGLRKANVMMLESPTGTGKSLSLACASLAWLKYREAADLKYLEDDNKMSSRGEGADEVNEKISKTSPSSSDWLDAWIPPDHVEKIEEQKRRNQACLDLAVGTRDALEKELDLIRNELKRSVRQELQRSAPKSKSNQESVRKARAQIAKKAVAEAKAHSRVGLKRGKIEIQAGKKRLWSENSGDFNQDCYCVDAYHSDVDTSNDANRYHDHPDALSDDEARSGGSIAQDTKRIPRNGNSSVADLIKGGNLDGSGSTGSVHRKQPMDHSITIGGVESGKGTRKIIYAARMHSQLSQFVGEIKRTYWGDKIRVITLGGRKLLCGNHEVTNGGKSSEAMITERCLDIQKGVKDPSTSTKPSCPLLKKDILPTLSLHMLAQPSDIEDLADLGKASKTCSYYASRESLHAAEVVVVPYNMLLSKSTREAVGLSLKKALVVIDEGHNIPEALRSSSSCKLTQHVIDRAMIQLKNYVSKYATRLAGRNIFYLGQIRRFLTAAAKHLRLSGRSKINPKNNMVTATELLFTLKLGNLNLFNILRYLEKSRLSQKLHGFTKAAQNDLGEDSIEEGGHSPNFLSKHISAMSIVESFLRCLTSTQTEGRVVIEIPAIDKETDNESRASAEIVPCFRYLLLDPSIEFKNVLEEAYSIILAGGTLRPFTHVATEIFGSEKHLVDDTEKAERKIDPNEKVSYQSSVSSSLTTFTCGHVVPPENVFLTCLSEGPSGILDLRHSSRCENATCTELGQTIIRISGIVPNGVVIFLSSYSYEAFLMKKWRNHGILDQIEKKKHIFREPKSTADVQSTLDSYSKKASSRQGAILFCVVGGKMSEGINFANEMARGVVIVGLPYADITDVVLRTKMDLLDKEFKEKKAPISGREYYQALCMRNVNQSIGRAIRHAKDYAAIILADARYEDDPKVWRDLPAWIRPDRKSAGSFNDNMDSIKDFFDNITL